MSTATGHAHAGVTFTTQGERPARGARLPTGRDAGIFFTAAGAGLPLASRTLAFYDAGVGHGWEVILEPEVSTWILDLPDDTYDRVEAAIDMLAEIGPGLGRPLVDSITESRHQNMKELRVGTCRILFAFDPARKAILLVAGDKRGHRRTWYPPAIALADQRFDDWLEHLKGGTP